MAARSNTIFSSLPSTLYFLLTILRESILKTVTTIELINSKKKQKNKAKEAKLRKPETKMRKFL